jgi:hypothetical protein
MAAIVALDLWELFVVNTFGGFWISVFMLAIVMFIIMCAIGKISVFSSLMYIFMFIFAMTLGWGMMVITIPISIMILWWFFYQLISYFGRAPAIQYQ